MELVVIAVIIGVFVMAISRAQRNANQAVDDVRRGTQAMDQTQQADQDPAAEDDDHA